MKLSVIIPCKNEEGNIKLLYDKLSGVLMDLKYELLFIDDGSDDNTLFVLKELYKNDKKHIKILSFSRNFRKEAAMIAGIEHASGEYTCIIDGDLQQNPKYLLEMIEFLDNNSSYDEVAMVIKNRNEGKIISFLKKMFYKTIDKLSDVHFEDAASDFRMFRKNVKKSIIELKEKNRFTKGIFSWIGFNIKYIPYDIEERNSGASSFGFINSIKYAFNGITNFSYKPLRLSLFLGIMISFVSIIYFLLILKNITMNSILLLFLMLFSGMQFIFIGIIGMYISNIQDEVKARPNYILKEKIGFEEK